MIETNIYWLVDMRPNPFWPNGEPFYCGMTTLGVRALQPGGYSHMMFTHSNTPVGRRVKACGQKMRVHTVAMPSGDGGAIRDAYRRALASLRHLNPECLNGTAGRPKRPSKAELSVHKVKQREAWKRRALVAERAQLGITR